MKKIKVVEFLHKLMENIKEKIFPQYKMDEREETVYNIIKNMLELPDTVFKIAPISNSYFISNETLQYNMKLSRNEIIIVNHAFSFTRKYTLQFHELLMTLVGEYVERDREAFEREIFKGELEVLKSIEIKVRK